MTYHPINEATEDQLLEIEDIITDPTIHDEDKRVLRRELQTISEELGRYEGTNALESFLIEFLRTAERGEVAVPDGGSDLRPEIEAAAEIDTKCTCGQITCPINNGRLPGQLKHHGTGRYRTVQDPEDELADFLRSHPEAEVFRRAKQIWDQWAGTLKGRISTLHAAALRAHRESSRDEPALGDSITQ